MSTETKDGGAAFPRATEQTVMGYPGTLEGERGMSLWDYFAAAALTGVLAQTSDPTIQKQVKDMCKTKGIDVADAMAEIAATNADAMIKVREKRRA